MKQPFEPDSQKEYSVTYAEGNQTRNLIGYIMFPEAGGVVVQRSRTHNNDWIYLPDYIKIERLTPR